MNIHMLCISCTGPVNDGMAGSPKFNEIHSLAIAPTLASSYLAGCQRQSNNFVQDWSTSGPLASQTDFGCLGTEMFLT